MNLVELKVKEMLVKKEKREQNKRLWDRSHMMISIFYYFLLKSY